MVLYDFFLAFLIARTSIESENIGICFCPNKAEFALHIKSTSHHRRMSYRQTVRRMHYLSIAVRRCDGQCELLRSKPIEEYSTES